MGEGRGGYFSQNPVPELCSCGPKKVVGRAAHPPTHARQVVPSRGTTIVLAMAQTPMHDVGPPEPELCSFGSRNGGVFGERPPPGHPPARNPRRCLQCAHRAPSEVRLPLGAVISPSAGRPTATHVGWGLGRAMQPVETKEMCSSSRVHLIFCVADVEDVWQPAWKTLFLRGRRGNRTFSEKN